MSRSCLAFWLIFSTFSLSAQNTIFLFDWEGTDPKQAAIGPSAATIGSRAFTTARLDGNSKGLAAPTTANTKQNIVMVLTDNPIFNVAGIDLSFDYQRDEGIATVFSRNNFRMGFDGMNVRYRVREASGACSAPISSPTTAIVDDNTYRTYRFRYDPNDGNAVLSVDGVQIYTNATKTPGQALCWDGDANITVGIEMDGSGTGNALLDNLRMQEVSLAGLPVELTVFEARPQGEAVKLHWQTASEWDNDYFAIERSGPEREWEEVVRLAGHGNSHEVRRYEATDAAPLPGLSYYRLKQVDYDGAYTLSPVKSVQVPGNLVSRQSVFPNPTSGEVVIQGTAGSTGDTDIYAANGREVTHQVPAVKRYGGDQLTIDLGGLPAGVYHIKNGAVTHRVVKR